MRVTFAPAPMGVHICRKNATAGRPRRRRASNQRLVIREQLHYPSRPLGMRRQRERGWLWLAHDRQSGTSSA